MRVLRFLDATESGPWDAAAVAAEAEYYRSRGWSVEWVVAGSGGAPAEALTVAVRGEPARTVVLPGAGDLLEKVIAYLGLKGVFGGDIGLFVCDRAEAAPLADALPPACLRILRPGSLRAGAPPHPLHRLYPRDAAKWPARALRGFHARTELGLLRYFDALALTNAADLSLLDAAAAARAVFVPPHVLAAEAPRTAEVEVLCAGGNSAADAHGITWFYHSVYVPYLWGRRIRLAVAGPVCARCDFTDRDVSFHPGGEVVGTLSLLPRFEGNVSSALTCGALASGAAVVTTPVAVRHLPPGRDAFLTLDMMAEPRQAADAVLGLLADAGRRRALLAAASDYLNEHFGRAAFVAAMDRTIELAQRNRGSAHGRAA